MTETPTPEQKWWSAKELAAAKLPGLPGTERSINRLAKREGWAKKPDAIKRRPGRGGGLFYHWSILPLKARLKLLKDLEKQEPQRPDRGAAWATYEGLSQKAKSEAVTRQDALNKVELLHQSGSTHVHAVETVAQETGVSPRTVYNWLAQVEGIAPEDRLAYLAPQPPKKRTKKEDRAKFQPFMDWLQSAYLRLEGPTFAQSYRIAVKQAQKHGWEFPIQKTAKRWMDAEVLRTVQVYKREGLKGLLRCFPTQKRDRTALSAMEAVNADCHKIDVFVRWPDGTVNRPQIVVFQDLYSNKFLSWRVDHAPNKVMVMAAFGEMVDNWRIPERCLFDNGHEFANKWMTAGAPTRFRFKIREDDPIGVLPQLGIKMHWANLASGQSKPIERGFRDIASDVAKDPRFAGAYVGNRPDAKPENYGNRAIPIDEFIEVLNEGIEEHNARTGRRTDTANGRSFDETFAESFATTTRPRATEEQRNLWLMGQETGKLHKHNGSLTFQKNVYHCAWMSQEAGKQVVIRFDPEDLHSGVHIYEPTGEYMGFAECQKAIGFFDYEEARSTAKKKRDIAKKHKELAKLYAPISPDQLADEMRSLSSSREVAPLTEAKVVSPDFKRHAKVQPLERYADPAAADARDAMVHELKTKKAAKPEPRAFEVSNSPEGRFQQMQDIQKRLAAGDRVGERERAWFEGFSDHPEYVSLLSLRRKFSGNDAG